MSSPAPSGAHAKRLGAYYTDHAVADFLVRWALRAPDARVCDPAFGGGVFLRAAAARLERLGGDPGRVYGVELEVRAHVAARRDLAAAGIPPANLLRDDFFALTPEALPPFDALVGNPPFIRYQGVSGAARARALERARAQGVDLPRRASSWAPFLAHASGFVKPGGRLAMVLPAELGHAAYARPLFAFLARAFGRIDLLTFARPLFPKLDQDTLLLLAADRGAPFRALRWRDLPGPEALAAPPPALHTAAPDAGASAWRTLDAAALATGRERLAHRLLPDDTLALYRRLGASQRCAPLGALARVGIGYVTGANRFFHLAPAAAEAHELPRGALAPTVFGGRALAGLRFERSDWCAAARDGRAGFLLRLTRESPRTPALDAYLARGEAEGVPRGTKCRQRTPWYRVPGATAADAFLTSMNGVRPRLVANPAGALASNALHVVRLAPDAPLDAATLAALWRSSLAELSAELEGHPMGGGMLKLEPGEAARVRLPLVPLPAALIDACDGLLRAGRDDEVRRRVDALALPALELTPEDGERLRAGAELLRRRRGS